MSPSTVSSLAFVLSAASLASAAEPCRFVSRLAAGQTQTLVVYGTSLTAGGAWVGQFTQALEQRYPGRVQVVNSGGSGMFSQWGVDNLDARVLQKQPDAVFIEFAINDAVDRFKTPVAQARLNLTNMIARIRQARPGCDVILMTMNPTLDGARQKRPNLAAYYQMYRDVAREQSLLLIDHAANWERLLTSDEARFRAHVPDGLHPAATGCSAVITPEILRAIGLSPNRAPPPIRILPLGDSITQGGRADREEYTYRLPLAHLLMDAGVAFDFIGSLSGGLQPQATWPDYRGTPFDHDHEGHYGWKTAQVRDHLAEWMPKWRGAPDIVLVHLGTNDQKPEDYDATIVRPLKSIIGMLRKQNPQVVVLLGHLNFNDGAALKIRPLVEALASELSTPAAPVVTVHHYKGWHERPDDPSPDTFDWAHPNPQGQRKMAQRWFDAMQPYLQRPR